jgi:hypothetical protein
VTPQRIRNVTGCRAIIELLDRQDRGERWSVERVTSKGQCTARAEAIGPLFEGTPGGCGAAVWCGETERENA